jgi:hypothetical protein
MNRFSKQVAHLEKLGLLQEASYLHSFYVEVGACPPSASLMLKPTMPASHDVTAIGTLYSTGTKSGITAAAVPKAPNPALTPTRTAWTLLLKPMLHFHLPNQLLRVTVTSSEAVGVSGLASQSSQPNLTAFLRNSSGRIRPNWAA